MLLCAMGSAYTKVFNKFTFTNNDEVNHHMEPQRQAARLVEVCPSEVVFKPPEISTTRGSTTMVKPTVVKVIRVTTRVGAAAVVWFTDHVSAPRTTGTATNATHWDILPNVVRIKPYIMLSMICIMITCIIIHRITITFLQKTTQR